MKKFIYTLLFLLLITNIALSNIKVIKESQPDKIMDKFGLSDLKDYQIFSGKISNISTSALTIDRKYSFYFHSNPQKANFDGVLKIGDQVSLYTLFNQVYYLEKEILNNTVDEKTNFQKIVLKFSDLKRYPYSQSLSWKIPKGKLLKNVQWYILRDNKHYDNSIQNDFMFVISNDNKITYTDDDITHFDITGNHTFQILGYENSTLKYISKEVEVKANNKFNENSKSINLKQKYEQVIEIDPVVSKRNELGSENDNRLVETQNFETKNQHKYLNSGIIQFDHFDFNQDPISITTHWISPQKLDQNKYLFFIIKDGRLYRSNSKDPKSFTFFDKKISYFNNNKKVLNKNGTYSYQLLVKNKTNHNFEFISEIASTYKLIPKSVEPPLISIKISNNDIEMSNDLKKRFSSVNDIKNYLLDNNEISFKYINNDPYILNDTLNIDFVGHDFYTNDLRNFFAKQCNTIGDLPIYIVSKEKKYLVKLFQILNIHNKSIQRTTIVKNKELYIPLYNKQNIMKHEIVAEKEDKTKNVKNPLKAKQNSKTSREFTNHLKYQDVQYSFKNDSCIAPSWKLPKSHIDKNTKWIVLRNGSEYDSNDDTNSFKINDETITYVNNWNIDKKNIYKYQLIGQVGHITKYYSDFIIVNKKNKSEDHESCILFKKFSQKDIDESKQWSVKHKTLTDWDKFAGNYKNLYHKYVFSLEIKKDIIELEMPYIEFKEEEKKTIGDLRLFVSAQSSNEKKVVASLLQLINYDNETVKSTTINKNIIYKKIIKMEE